MKKVLNFLFNILAIFAGIGMLCVAENILVQLLWTGSCATILILWLKHHPEIRNSYDNDCKSNK